MGTWIIAIEGIGPHHTKSVTDSDWLARDLVDKLQNAGHNVTLATFEGETLLPHYDTPQVSRVKAEEPAPPKPLFRDMLPEQTPKAPKTKK